MPICSMAGLPLCALSAFDECGALATTWGRPAASSYLPDAFAADPDRLARFTREAQVLASLNHPNIAQIHGIEKRDDAQALVLELVEGPTLADRIAKGPIPLDEALPIAKQIAEALEAAHEAGVIHRDLKPANIKVREDGTVKVLDFGLAKAMDTTPEGDPSQSPTLTAAATQMGVIMGTAAYMSPEQAKGKIVDKRADVWAFGVVLYEMLTGRQAFEGDSPSEVLAEVIKSDARWDVLPASLPPGVQTYLRRCLQKDPRERVRDIGDVRLAMTGAFDLEVPAVSAPPGPTPPDPLAASAALPDPREVAIQRLKARLEFKTHVVTYVVVNMVLMVIWFATGRGYFWPIFPIAGWGIALAFHAWDTFGGRPINEADVQREMKRRDGA